MMESIIKDTMWNPPNNNLPKIGEGTTNEIRNENVILIYLNASTLHMSLGGGGGGVTVYTLTSLQTTPCMKLCIYLFLKT